MSIKILISFAAAAMVGLGAVALSSAPASAYDEGYCYHHPYDPACLAVHVHPYWWHDHDHYHDHHHDHDHDHHDHHDHDHDHHHH